MAKRIIDLCEPIEHMTVNDPEGQQAAIAYWDHKLGAPSMLSYFQSATEEDLPGGLGWASEGLMLTTHTGTHMDAPYHYHPYSGGEPAKTIDQVPVEWFVNDGVMLDFSDRPTGTRLMAKDFQDALEKIGYTLKPLDIVFIRTGAEAYWNTPDYMKMGCGVGREATLWLIEQGVRIVGTDAWSWDRPLSLEAADFEKTHDKSLIWEGHFAGIEHEYCHIEKMAHLDKLPPYGFTAVCVPIKVKSASGGWVRPLAIIED